jgi:hypothetical protein
MANVVKFYPADAGKNPNMVLEQAVGIYNQVLVIGYDKEGNLDVRASLNFTIRDIFFALEAFKFQVFNGDYGHQLDRQDPES